MDNTLDDLVKCFWATFKLINPFVLFDNASDVVDDNGEIRKAYLRHFYK